MYDRDVLDAIAVTSFMIGVANYRENLTQSDKDEIINRLDQQTRDILSKVQKSLEEQNKMLREIMKVLEEKEKDDV